MGRSGPGWKRASASSYEITFQFQGRRCRERVALEPSAANDKRIAQFRAAVIESIDRGTFDYAYTFPHSERARQFAVETGVGMTVRQHLEEWLERTRPTVAESTFRDYRRSVMNVLIPAFGDYPLQDLRRRDIRDWCARSELSNKRIGNVLSPLRIALREAVEDELIDANPLHGWSYKRKEEKAADHVDPLGADEQRAVLAAAPEGSGRNLLQFALWTGMRTSELVALEWQDVDWRRGEVRVQRAQAQGVQAGATKTTAGTRAVRLLPPALEALKAQRALSELHPSGRIWLNPRTGEPWTGDQAIRKTLWTPTLKRAKVRYRNPYQTRHTYASMMLSAGEPPRWVASQMGHSDLHMIFRTYSRWIPDANPEAGSGAVAAFWREA